MRGRLSQANHVCFLLSRHPLIFGYQDTNYRNQYLVLSQSAGLIARDRLAVSPQLTVDKKHKLTWRLTSYDELDEPVQIDIHNGFTQAKIQFNETTAQFNRTYDTLDVFGWGYDGRYRIILALLIVLCYAIYNVSVIVFDVQSHRADKYAWMLEDLLLKRDPPKDRIREVLGAIQDASPAVYSLGATVCTLVAHVSRPVVTTAFHSSIANPTESLALKSR